MFTQALEQDFPESLAFSRLYALAQRGYRPRFGTRANLGSPAFIELIHPKRRGAKSPPRITLWSDGIIVTTELLWPDQYVPTQEGPPNWQHFIAAQEIDRFESFASSIAQPDVLDLYLFPAMRHAKLFAARMLFGSALCVVCATSIKLCQYIIP